MIQSWHETLVTSQVDGTAVTAASPTSCIPAAAKYTLRPNFLDRLGQKLYIKASGRVSSVITTPGTMRFDVRLGATVVFDGLAVLLDTAAAHTNVGWWLEMELTVRAIGTSANLMGQGFLTSRNLLGAPTAPAPALTAMLPWNSAPAVGNNFDSTASQQVDIFFTQTVATGSLTVHQYELIAAN